MMAAFGAGLVVGGLLAAAFFLVVGSLLRPLLPDWARLTLVGLFLVFIALREYGRFSAVRMPENRRLVPVTVFRLGRLLGPFQFGLEMGTGARTYLPSGLPYVMAVAVAFFASPLLTVLAGVGFGIGRSIMTVASVSYGDDSAWDDEWDIHQRLLVTFMVAAFAAALGTGLTGGF
ncbi:hypothetical protein GCM10010123_38470 [Pilimelia anulata]|uniref:Uncharacterized protein n=1 Tax=Pilimelia anulata TaxID=53371 RepID=A0A8J3FBI0_9ACTN|nr:hypothetical protein [Pilimelia anulata]GGK04801.1 hypothetical protein GCM10010123_38470 [Pilimelia anulata]